MAWTSNNAPLASAGGWQKNCAGFWTNSAFGFGLLNALDLVQAANPATWKNVPQKAICEVKTDKNRYLEYIGIVISCFDTKGIIYMRSSVGSLLSRYLKQ